MGIKALVLPSPFFFSTTTFFYQPSPKTDLLLNHSIHYQAQSSKQLHPLSSPRTTSVNYVVRSTSSLSLSGTIISKGLKPAHKKLHSLPLYVTTIATALIISTLQYTKSISQHISTTKTHYGRSQVSPSSPRASTYHQTGCTLHRPCPSTIQR